MFKVRWAIFAVVLGAVLPAPAVAASDDRTITVSGDDAEMNAAIVQARASLGTFWRQYEHPDPGISGLSLKVRITEGRYTEHFWLIDIQRDGDTLSGVVNNDPELVHNVKLGQRYQFGATDISDWMYLHNDKIVGNLTLRVLLNHMSPEEAAGYRAMLEKP
jgi:uncharacterized protein YegJ (DUF2314 family)